MSFQNILFVIYLFALYLNRRQQTAGGQRRRLLCWVRCLTCTPRFDVVSANAMPAAGGSAALAAGCSNRQTATAGSQGRRRQAGRHVLPALSDGGFCWRMVMLMGDAFLSSQWCVNEMETACGRAGGLVQSYFTIFFWPGTTYGLLWRWNGQAAIVYVVAYCW